MGRGRLRKGGRRKAQTFLQLINSCVPFSQAAPETACQGVNTSVNKQAGCQPPEISLAPCPPVEPLGTTYPVKRGGIPCLLIASAATGQV